MLDNEKREQIALRRFSLISPVLNGQVDNQKEYFIEVTSKAIDMPHYGMRMYSPKTLGSWLSDYRRGGIDALKPGYRADRGKSRKIDDELVEKIREKRRLVNIWWKRLGLLLIKSLLKISILILVYGLYSGRIRSVSEPFSELAQHL